MDSNAATEIEIASSLLVRSRVFLDAWFLSAGVDGRSAFRPFWEEVWPFWRFNEHALLFAHIVNMAGLFETRSDTINFHRIWRNMKNMPSAQGKLLEVGDLFAEAAPIARKIAILRSNAMAHRSANLNYNDAFKKAKIAANDMIRLTNISLVIINVMQTIIGVPTSEFDENAIYELRALAARPSE